MKILKNLFGKQGKIHVDEIATKIGGIATVLSNAIIVDFGSNSNGSFVKFGGGLQICWHRKAATSQITNVRGSLYSTTNTEWEYPLPFTGAPATASGVVDKAANCWSALGSVGSFSSKTSFVVYSTQNITEIPIVSLIAIGRWK